MPDAPLVPPGPGAPNAAPEVAPTDRPAQRTAPEPLGTGRAQMLGTAAAAGVVGGSAAAASVVTLVFSAAVMAVLLPLALDACWLVCAVGLVGLLPAQGMLMVAVSTLSPLLAALVTDVVVRAQGRRVPLPTLVAANGAGSLGAFFLAGVVQALGAVGTCMCSCCFTVGAMGYLVDNYGWANDRAEYYVFRRVTPAVFYSCLAGSQLCALAAMASGVVGSAALTAAAIRWASVPEGSTRPPPAPVDDLAD